MKRPTVSIIIPTYNRAYIIKNAIKSVINQTFQYWEILVIDDGSTDDTREVVDSFKDKRIRYHKQDNCGPSAARNLGVSLSCGKWVAYLDSDNELLPRYLETMLEWLEKTPKAVFGIPNSKRTKELYENGKLTKVVNSFGVTSVNYSLKDVYMKKFQFDTNGFMHLRDVFDEDIRWDPAINAIEDWDLAMTMGEKYPDGFLHIPVVLCNYYQRFGGDGIVSNNTYGDWANVYEKIYQKHKNDKLLAGQGWYPSKVNKWLKLQNEYDSGKIPAYHLYYFQ